MFSMIISHRLADKITLLLFHTHSNSKHQFLKSQILIGENKGINDVALDFKFLEIIFQLKGQPIPYVLLHGAIIVPFFFVSLH